MPTIPSIGESIPKIKASLPEFSKFLLLALGWLLGRILHVEIGKKITAVEPLISFPALLDNTKNYYLSQADLAMLAIAAVLAWMLYKWGKILKWLGAGIFLYIITFELAELLYGTVLTTWSRPEAMNTTTRSGI